MSRSAPGLTRLLSRQTEAPIHLALPPGLRSLRGIDALETLETLSVPALADLSPVARLPRLTSLFLDGTAQARRGRVRLAPLATAPALVSLTLHNLSARIEGLSALAAIPTLRSLELGSAPCPDLRALTGTGLELLALDGVSRLRPWMLSGLPVSRLDLWGCGLEDVDVLATMPNLKEVWLQGNRVRSLRPLHHLTAGARVFLDGDVDPAAHRPDIAALEAQGVWLMICHDPSDHGIHPSWWSGGASVPADQRSPIRYQSPSGA